MGRALPAASEKCRRNEGRTDAITVFPAIFRRHNPAQPKAARFLSQQATFSQGEILAFPGLASVERL
jgi:hypothetical protein